MLWRQNTHVVAKKIMMIIYDDQIATCRSSKLAKLRLNCSKCWSDFSKLPYFIQKDCGQAIHAVPTSNTLTYPWQDLITLRLCSVFEYIEVT